MTTGAVPRNHRSPAGAQHVDLCRSLRAVGHRDVHNHAARVRVVLTREPAHHIQRDLGHGVVELAIGVTRRTDRPLNPAAAVRLRDFVK